MSYLGQQQENESGVNSLTSDLNNLSMGAGKNRKKKTSHVFHSNLINNNFQLQEQQHQQQYYQDPHSTFDPNAAAGSIGYNAPEFTNGSSYQKPFQNNGNFSPNLQAFASHSNSSPHIGGTETYQPPTQQPSYPQMNSFDPASRPGLTQRDQSYSTQQKADRLTVPDYRYLGAKEWFNIPFRTFQNACPPPSGTDVKVIDQGNASPEFIRMSMYNIPTTNKLKEQSGIPVGLVLRPFAPDYLNGNPIPVVDFRTLNVVPRCGRCRAYVNPAMVQTGYDMTCNMCRFVTQLPTEYSSPLDMNGNRVDLNQHPELYSGIYDILLPDEYLTKDTPYSPINHVFLIDISHESLKNELHKAAVSAIRMALWNEETGECRLPKNSKISVIAYDDKVHFYDLSPDLEQTTVSIMTDSAYPFLPFYNGILADPMESYNIIEATLNTIESINGYSENFPVLATALTCAKFVLKEVGGGQVTALLSSIPGGGSTTLRPKVKGDRDQHAYDRDVITAGSEPYKKLTTELLEEKVGVNIFVASTSTSIDLANVGYLAEKTGGKIRTWYNYKMDSDEIDLTYALTDSVSQVKATDVILKIRCSSGLQVSKYYGGFKTTGTDTEPSLAVAHEDTTIACDFVYDGTLATKFDAHFQAALLYTDKEGGRRARIINSIVAVTESISKVCEFADQEGILGLMIRNATSRLPNMNFTALRSFLQQELSTILANYKMQVAQHSSPAGDLIIPQGLNVLPMFILAATKSKAFKEIVANPDLRVQSLNFLNNFPLSKLSMYLYPAILPLHSMEEEECTYDEETEAFHFPKTVPASVQSLEFGGAYLLFNGLSFILWLHPDVNPLLLQDLLGVGSLDNIDPSLTRLYPMDNHLSKQVNNLIKFLTKHYSNQSFCPVKICRFQKDPIESEFIEMMYDDKSSQLVPSYADFLKQLHKSISQKIENSRASSITDATTSSRFALF